VAGGKVGGSRTGRRRRPGPGKGRRAGWHGGPRILDFSIGRGFG